MMKKFRSSEFETGLDEAFVNFGATTCEAMTLERIEEMDTNTTIHHRLHTLNIRTKIDILSTQLIEYVVNGFTSLFTKHTNCMIQLS